MSISLIPTAVDLVHATPDTAFLVQTFLSCPDAAKLLDSWQFIKPMCIESSNFQNARTRISVESSNFFQWLRTRIMGSNLNSCNAQILIPETQLQRTAEALDSLAFEIFNAQFSSNIVKHIGSDEAKRMGMDAYARQSEELEHSRTLPYHKLMSQCAKAWKLSLEQVEKNTYFANRDKELDLFNQEYGCHTDWYRRQWIEKYQDTYCKKRPDDARSCTTKKEELCNIEDLQKLSPSKREKFKNARICKLFPQAHEKVKNDPDFRKIVKETCPEALSRFIRDL